MTPVAVEHLTVRYGQGIALEDVSWSAAAGSFWAIVGPNGSGKTTLLKTVLGLLPVASGLVELFGSDTARFDDWRRIGYLPQFTGLPFPRFPATVREIVGLGRLAGKRFPRFMRREDVRAVSEALERFGVAQLAARPIGALSGGQRQRVFLARSLVNAPDLLLLDEPALALDPDGREQFYELLSNLNRASGTTVILVTHDSATAGRYAGNLLYLDRRVVFSGDFASFCASPRMTHHFGADAQHSICHQHVLPRETVS